MTDKLETYYVKHGSEKTLDCGFRTGTLTLESASGILLFAISKKDRNEIAIPIGHHVELQKIDPSSLRVRPTTDGINTFTLLNTDGVGNVERRQYVIPSFQVMVDCDADRDGRVGLNESGKSSWVWGPDGPGAIVLVDNDKDLSRFPGRRSELAPLIVRTTGLSKLSHELGLRLYATRRAVRRFSIYRLSRNHSLTRILGVSGRSITNLSVPLNPLGEKLWVAAHEYPHDDFEGLISIELHLRQRRKGVPEGVLLQSDRVVFRVAPWMMIPCTAPVERVYTCDLTEVEPLRGDERLNRAFKRFIKDLRRDCGKKRLTVIQKRSPKGKKEDLEDPWVQDQMEIGYNKGVYHQLHVVVNSPRRGQLREFPEQLQGPDVGLFEFRGKQNSLDSFGNLEVSPPVNVKGHRHPFGRIIFGGREYVDFSAKNRQMMPRIRRFLYEQKVQSPIEVLTDWLQVGHVDEILTFVPCEGGKNFKVLIAWPSAVYQLLKKLSREGYGDAVLFKGKFGRDRNLKLTVPMEISVDGLLTQKDIWIGNDIFQEYMNLNRAILMKHLGLVEDDFIEIPVLFTVRYTRPRRQRPRILLQRTGAHFPNMVNQLVLGRKSIVPKPFGPVIEGKCAFERDLEERFRGSVPNQKIIFIDCWDSHHVWSGEVHCATNVRRRPPELPWWHIKPSTAYNV